MVRPNTLKKRLKLAQKLANKNGGRLPYPWKMIQQGHGGLYRYMRRNRKEFTHFNVEKAVGTERLGNFNVAIRKEHLAHAAQLARKNEGILPDLHWLIRHGCTRLASYVKTYPHVFDIKAPKGVQEKSNKLV